MFLFSHSSYLLHLSGTPLTASMLLLVLSSLSARLASRLHTKQGPRMVCIEGTVLCFTGFFLAGELERPVLPVVGLGLLAGPGLTFILLPSILSPLGQSSRQVQGCRQQSCH